MARNQSKPKPTPLKLTLKQLDGYLREHGTADPAAPLKGLPFAKDGRVFFTAKHLLAHLDHEAATRQTLSKALRDMGAKLIQFPAKKANGKKTAPAYWKLERRVSGVPEPATTKEAK